MAENLKEGKQNKGVEAFRRRGLPVSATAPVGRFPAGPWGLLDMHGNVSEWCEDVWHDSYAGAPADGSAWTAGGLGDRIYRGGNWANHARYCRSAARGWFPPGDGDSSLGFRPTSNVSGH